MAAAYIDRLKRLQRGLTKIKKVDRCPAEYGDDLVHFFVDCYHLKDHIKNDISLPGSIQNSVETYLNKNIYLRLCADLANRDKHLVLLSRSIRDDAKFGRAEIDAQTRHTIQVRGDLWINFIEVKDGVEKPPEITNPEQNTIENCHSLNHVKTGSIEQKYYVKDDNGKSYDASILAEKCYQAWIDFLKVCQPM